jgi:hypothetical protein
MRDRKQLTKQRAAFDKAKALGIDVAGMCYATVLQAIEAHGGATPDEGGEKGADVQPVNLDKLKKAQLVAIAAVVEADLSKASNNKARAEAIRGSGNWPEDPEVQVKIVECITD